MLIDEAPQEVMTVTTLRVKKTTVSESGPIRKSRIPVRPRVISAVFTRDFLGYFSNPAGYVFITLFVLVCSWAEFWQPIFFANNLANLAPLNEWMPYILLFFIPAITMSAWAEERKQGTEELLLTLPARDVEVVLGKYFAALGIFTAAIFFLALGHFPILYKLGPPDFGVLIANYFGYWLIGALLIAIGMTASMLSSNSTVAFILGALFCSAPIFARLIGSPTAGSTRRFIEGLSISEQVRDFGNGVIPLPSVAYFLSLTVVMLYLNMVLLGRRHWAGGQASRGRWLHVIIRVVALLAAIISVDVIVARVMGSWRADLTAERLHTLSSASIKIIKAIPKDRPVFIEAYLSPEVPKEYVQVRLDLISTLREFAAIDPERIRLNIVSTERYSNPARDAEKRYGIKAREVRTVEEAKFGRTAIIMGLAVTSGLEEVVIPFFDRGLPVEYEVARSVRVASGAKRKRVGILGTDAKLLGGVDFQAMTPDSEWAIITELKKQYDVSSIAPDAAIPTDLAVLIVAQPSSLTQRQMAHLTRYIRAGRPTLLLCDPLPVTAISENPDLIPREPRRGPGAAFGQPPPEPKGNLKPLMTMLGVVWPDDEIAWNGYNPHKKYLVGKQNIFIGQDSTPTAFGRDPSTAGLQEILLPYPGVLYSLAGAGTKMKALLSTDDLGGTIAYDQMIRMGQFGPSFNPDPPYRQNAEPMTIAARVTGPLPPEATVETGKDGKPFAKTDAAQADVILIADMDFIGNEMLALRLKPTEAFDELDFDNTTFMLNCVDSLAGDETFLPLRGRRSKHRTLKRVEEQSRQYVVKAEKNEQAADEARKTELAAAQERLDKQVKEVEANKELDDRAREASLQYRQTVEKRRLAVAKAEIEDRRSKTIEEIRATRVLSIQQIQNGIRVQALFLPPLPVLILGAFVFFLRFSKENRGAPSGRLA